MPNNQQYFSQIRKDSQRRVMALGYRINPALPLLETRRIKRSARDIACRAMVLHACCAVSYGFEYERAAKWVKNNGLWIHAASEEILLLEGGRGDPQFKYRPEAVWALAWVVGKTARFELLTPMPGDAVFAFPDLKKDEDAAAWMAGADVRDSHSMVAALDVYYCLHWALQDGILRGVSTWDVSPWVIVERRRALEWCSGEQDWDEVSLDT